VQAFAVGRPKRGERPLWIPSHAAVAFGDTIVGTPEGEIRMWAPESFNDKKREWFHETYAPTFAPLTALPVERVLVTHGAPVLEDGRDALAGALAADPWYHAG
jgi:hypothetical protein